eukprot:TRINITY_DN624_c0_g1_i2.p1 TRINITY_DN624_c0_g1~~TRINITY_DN624_c0_g1_i2.p1  ORF type:complete len:1262 (+),score=294.30 TRINITY_DN624_c0_g1_i2:23-3808(+)
MMRGFTDAAASPAEVVVVCCLQNPNLLPPQRRAMVRLEGWLLITSALPSLAARGVLNGDLGTDIGRLGLDRVADNGSVTSSMHTGNAIGKIVWKLPARASLSSNGVFASALGWESGSLLGKFGSAVFPIASGDGGSSFEFDHGPSYLIFGDVEQDGRAYRPEFTEMLYGSQDGMKGYASTPRAALQQELKLRITSSTVHLGQWTENGTFEPRGGPAFTYSPQMKLVSDAHQEAVGKLGGGFWKAPMLQPSILQLDSLFSDESPGLPSLLRAAEEVAADSAYAVGTSSVDQGGLARNPDTLSASVHVEWLTPVVQKFRCVPIPERYSQPGAEKLYFAMGWDVADTAGLQGDGLDLDLSLVPFDRNKNPLPEKMVWKDLKAPAALGCKGKDMGAMHGFIDHRMGTEPGDEEVAAIDLACLDELHPEVDTVAVLGSIFRPSTMTWRQVRSAYLRILSGGAWEHNKQGDRFGIRGATVRSYIRLSGDDLKADPELQEQSLVVGLLFRERHKKWTFVATMKGVAGSNAGESMRTIRSFLWDHVYPASPKWDNTAEHSASTEVGSFAEPGIYPKLQLHNMLAQGQLPCIASRQDHALILLGHISLQDLQVCAQNKALPASVRSAAKALVSKPKTRRSLMMRAQSMAMLASKYTMPERMQIGSMLGVLNISEPTDSESSMRMRSLLRLYAEQPEMATTPSVIPDCEDQVAGFKNQALLHGRESEQLRAQNVALQEKVSRAESENALASVKIATLEAETWRLGNLSQPTGAKAEEELAIVPIFKPSFHWKTPHEDPRSMVPTTTGEKDKALADLAAQVAEMTSVKQLELENWRLGNLSEELQRQNENMHQNITSELASKRSLEAMLAKSANESKQLEAQNAKLLLQVKNLTSDKAAAESELAEVTSEKLRLANMTEHLGTRNDLLQQQAITADSTKSAAEAQLEKSETANRDLNRLNNELRTKLAALEKQVSNAGITRGEAEAVLEAQNAELLLQVESLTSDQAAAESVLAEVTSEKWRLAHKTAELSKSNDVLKQQALTTVAQLAKSETAILDLNNLNEELRTKIAALEQRVSDANAARGQTEAALEAQNAKLLLQVESLTSDKAAAESELAKVTSEKRLLANRTEYLSTRNDVLKQQALTADSTKAAAEAQLAKSETDIQDLNSLNEQLRTNIAALEKQVSDANIARGKAEAALEEAGNPDVQDLLQQLKRVTNSKGRLEAQVKVMEPAVSGLRECERKLKTLKQSATGDQTSADRSWMDNHLKYQG